MVSTQRSIKISAGTAIMLLLALLMASCTSFHWITPVPGATGAPVEEAAPADVETPEPPEPATTDATATPAAEEEAVQGEEEDADDQAAEEMPADVIGPSPVTHALARHEVCTDCHAVDARRVPAPADHQWLTDAVCLYCHLPQEGAEAVPPLPAKADVEFCLGCHGPHEELLARSAGYTTPDGLAGNPHMFIPHESQAIASCANCHGVHAIPLTAEDMVPQATLQYCFSACHHEKDWTPCSECH